MPTINKTYLILIRLTTTRFVILILSYLILIRLAPIGFVILILSYLN